MPNILALITCVEPHEGAWLRPLGREAGVKVYPELGAGERLVVETEGDGDRDANGHYQIHYGFNPLPWLAGVIRYRVVKYGSGTPTTVEVVRDVSAQRQNRHAQDTQRAGK